MIGPEQVLAQQTLVFFFFLLPSFRETQPEDLMHSCNISKDLPTFSSQFGNYKYVLGTHPGGKILLGIISS